MFNILTKYPMTDIHKVITLIMNYIDHCKVTIPNSNSNITDITIHKQFMFKSRIHRSIYLKFTNNKLRDMYELYEQHTPKIY